MPCPDEDTIQQIFDALTYSKGASCLKMVMNWTGEEGFLKGVSNYLKANLYSNATTSDLLTSISETTGKDVSTLLKNWLGKTGFPLVEVEETEKGLKVSQRRFLSTGDATVRLSFLSLSFALSRLQPESSISLNVLTSLSSHPQPEEDQTIWHIPLQLLVVSADGKKTIKSDLVLTERSTEISIPDIKSTTYKLNANTCGVYRTLYSNERLSKLGDEAGKAESAFSLEDRIGLVADASALASSGYAKTSGAFTLVSKLKGETENLGTSFFLFSTVHIPLLTLPPPLCPSPKSGKKSSTLSPVSLPPGGTNPPPSVKRSASSAVNSFFPSLTSSGSSSRRERTPTRSS
jgi:aminopeptidase 2